MPLYDLRCDCCKVETERKLSYADAQKQICDCGGNFEIFITQVNLSPDATPTRGWGKFSDAPKLVKNDGSELNPGHEPPTTADLRLTPDQVSRLNL